MGSGRTSWDGDVVVAGFRAEHGAPAKCEVAISFMKWQEMELHAGLFDCSRRVAIGVDIGGWSVAWSCSGSAIIRGWIWSLTPLS